MGKKLSIIVMSLLAVSLMGCTQSAPDKDYEAKTQEVAGKENPPIEVQDLEILEQGFVYTVDEWDYAYASFGVIIENPNTDYAFTNTKARVSVKDSAGVILATQDYYINQMLPEEIYGFGDSIEIVGEAAEVAVTLIDGNSSSVDSSYAAFSPLKVTQANLVEDDYSLNIVGAIENGNEKTYDTVVVGVVFRESSGAIVGGVYNYVDDVLPGETPFSIYLNKGSIADSYAEIKGYAHIQ